MVKFHYFRLLLRFLTQEAERKKDIENEHRYFWVKKLTKKKKPYFWPPGRLKACGQKWPIISVVHFKPIIMKYWKLEEILVLAAGTFWWIFVQNLPLKKKSMYIFVLNTFIIRNLRDEKKQYSVFCPSFDKKKFSDVFISIFRDGYKNAALVTKS